MKHVKLIVLDLDGTLIDTSSKGIYKIETNLGTLMLTPRPHLQEFLNYCFDNFNVGIYTAATRPYALDVLKIILNDSHFSKIKFLKCYDNCSRRVSNEIKGEFNDGDNYIIYKPLKSIWNKNIGRKNGWTKDNTLIIEDTPETCIKNYGNAIYVPSFKYYKKDDTLKNLIYFIKHIETVGKIRSLEKRKWSQTNWKMNQYQFKLVLILVVIISIKLWC